MSKAELAGRLGLGIGEVSAWESGRRRPRPDQVAAVADALAVTVDAILPPRRPLPASAEDDRVAAFVRLVTLLRGTAPGTALRFRAADLEQLALALGAEVTDVEGRIAALTACTPGEAAELGRRLRRRRLLVPIAAGVFAAAALVTGTPATAPS